MITHNVKTFIAILGVVMMSNIAFKSYGQGSNSKPEEGPEEELEHPAQIAEVMPVYPGGEKALREDVYKNIVYPEFEKEKKISGPVYISFVVERDGSVSNVKAVRVVPGGNGLTLAAENAVKSLKPFEPAKMNGRPVRIEMTMPIKFTL